MFKSRVVISGLLLFAAALFTTTSVAWGGDKENGDNDKEAFKDVKLPEGTDVMPTSLRVSFDHRFVLYQIMTGEPIPHKPTRSDVIILDTKNGTTKKLSDLLPKEFSDHYIGTVHISPKYNKALFGFIPYKMDDSPTMLLNLETSKCSEFKVGDKKIARACWAGDRIAYSTIEDDEQMGEIKFIDNAGKTEGTGVYGQVMTASDDGGILLVKAIPDAMNKPFPLKDFRKAIPLFIDAKGKLIGNLGGVNMSQQPVFSPGGKYIAFQVRDNGFLVKVFTVDLKSSVKIKVAGLAIGVTDEGEVLTRSMMFGGDKGSPLKMWDKEGKKSIVLVKNAGDAVVVGDTVFYVVPCDEPVIKAVKFKRPEAPKK